MACLITQASSPTQTSQASFSFTIIFQLRIRCHGIIQSFRILIVFKRRIQITHYPYQPYRRVLEASPASLVGMALKVSGISFLSL